MRLIDADRLKEAFNEDVMNHMSVIDTSTVNLLMIEIDEIPTAYDVDKVLEQLEENKINCKNSNTILDTDDYVNLDKAIEIVKRGNKNEFN